ncbi:hypothetical protein KSX_17340 [Ktedonospora formicarum]|uniref:3-keto-disaccharide hydrolase domain-containing protein n=2 Tax=Ktedonospora formicarum TaxID=2778364 RepID=A0A8J3MR95_9CHLR|nr:hypothetical protein KSX_17340 [Ktedonospora formicarum]
MSGGKIALIILAVFVVLAGVSAAIAIPAYNTAQDNAHSTATAEAQSTANAQATATYIATHFPFSSKQVLNDTLASNNSEHGWASDSLCKFSGGSYLAQESKENTFLPCVAKSTDYTDFSYEVTMKNMLGNAGGLIFRADDAQQEYYLYMAFYDGSFGFYYYNHSSGFKKVITGDIADFSTSKVVLGVTAKGSQFQFFANGKQVGEASNSTFSHGQIGVVVDNDNLISQANFSDAKVWQI